MNDTKIVTRHSGAVAWLKSKGITGEVLSHILPDDMKERDRIFGVLPIQMIAEGMKRGAEMNILVLPNLPREMRGKEITAEEMEHLGGVKILRVKSLALEKVEM